MNVPVSRAALGVAAILASAILAGCASQGASAPARTTAPLTTVPATATVPAQATPQMLPVTPEAGTYTVADAAFEPLPGARALWGVENGAAYQIEVPANWNGRVVFYAHGYRFNLPELTLTFPPIREHLVARGYAWAASSFSRNGYEPGAGARDTYALRDVFAREVGEPSASYLYGQSMGGHVVSLLMEQYPQAYDGALSECGAVAGNDILDYFVSWALLAGYFSDSDVMSVSDDAAALGQMFGEQVLPALGTADEPTAAGRAFADAIEQLTGGPRPFFDEGYSVAYGINFGVLQGAVAASGTANAAADNTQISYALGGVHAMTSEQLNQEITRVRANPAARDRATHPEFADMTGAIARPFLTVHNTGDMFVPISMEQAYAAQVEAAGRSDLLVQRAVRRAGHCAFSQQELTRAFDDLVTWAERGVRPAGDDLRGDLSNAGVAFTEPFEATDVAAAAGAVPAGNVP